MCRAGGAIACGPLHVITRVAGPQALYRAELQSFAVNLALATAHQELTYDNKAVVDHALQPPPMSALIWIYGLSLRMKQ